MKEGIVNHVLNKMNLVLFIISKQETFTFVFFLYFVFFYSTLTQIKID